MNPYDESETEYSEASEIDMSSHHDVKITKQFSRTLSQRRAPPSSSFTHAGESFTPRPPRSAEGDQTTYLNEAPSFISPMKVKRGEHFSSPKMAALAFHDDGTPNATPTRTGEDAPMSAYEDDEIPDHTTHQAEFDSLDERIDGSISQDVEMGDGEGMRTHYGESSVLGSGRKTRRGKSGRKQATGFLAILYDTARDCAQYLKDIECHEVVPDCRLKTWQRLLCTKQGRSSIMRPVYHILQGLVHYTKDPRSWQKGTPFIFFGLALSFTTEIFAGPHNSGPHYNSAIILSLLCAAGYKNFPERRMAPQIIIALIAGLSLAMDFVTIALSPAPLLRG